jgi:hypothetical protein
LGFVQNGKGDLKGCTTHYQLPIPWAIRFPGRKASDEFVLQIENMLSTATSPKDAYLHVPKADFDMG